MNWTLLHKYLSEENTETEKRQVEAWAKSDPKNMEFLKSLEKIWDVEPDDEMEIDSRAAWQSFKEKLSEEKRPVAKKRVANIYKLRDLKPQKYSENKRGRGYRQAIAIFAATAAVVLITFLFYQFSIQNMRQLNDAAVHRTKAQEITTGRGQRTTLSLYDGTRVQLNAESKIRIPAGFGDSTRIVFLEGQAFFEVTHNEEIPFIVHSGEVTTRVLGTKFDVMAYPEENQVQVVVEEGKVALQSSKTEETEENHVNGGQIGRMTGEGGVEVEDTSELERYLGWKEGRLTFNSTTFGEAIPKLERWYDIQIEVSDSLLKSKTLTASFKDEPMTEVMNIISLSLDMYYEREGRTFIFKSSFKQ